MSPQVNQANFGHQIATFRGPSIELRTWVLIIIPGFLLTSSSFIYGMLLAGDAYQQHGPALALIRGRSWFMFSTILLVILSAYILYRLLISSQRLEIFENGIQNRSFFLRRHVYYWSELSGIASSATKITFFGKDIRTVPSGVIYLYTGKSIELTNRFQNIPRLVEIVKSKTYPLIWPTLKSTFRFGSTAQFGILTLTREHLHIAKKSIPWESVSRLRVESGFLVVELRDNSEQQVPISDIPNLELLLQCVDWGIQI